MSDETTTATEATASETPAVRTRRPYTRRAAAPVAAVDSEVSAISAVMSALAPLDTEAVTRVLDYVRARTGLAPAAGRGGTVTVEVTTPDAPGPIRRTPLEWLDTPEHRGTIIRDNDGWTWDEWKDQAPVTHGEFVKRLAKCSILTGEAADAYRAERKAAFGQTNPFAQDVAGVAGE